MRIPHSFDPGFVLLRSRLRCERCANLPNLGLNIDIPKNGTGGDKSNGNGNDQASNFVRLTNVVNGYNSNLLCPPLTVARADFSGGDGSWVKRGERGRVAWL